MDAYWNWELGAFEPDTDGCLFVDLTIEPNFASGQVRIGMNTVRLNKCSKTGRADHED